MTLYSEEFLEWANDNEEEYIIFFENALTEIVGGDDPNEFLKWAFKNEEEFNDMFEDEIAAIIEEYEERDYFGTEGFNKRFSV